MFSLLFIIIALGLGLYIFLQQTQFGKAPAEARLEKIKQSPNYVDGQFRNQTPKPVLTEGVSHFRMYMDFLFSRDKRTVPDKEIPSRKTNLKTLKADEDVLVWFGHSSYFMQIGGKRILVDPVFNSTVSPVSFITQAFAGTNRYTADDLPEIDYIFISHDHWDHLDYKTLVALKAQTTKVICGLGVGAHLEHWGFEPEEIIEADWYEKLDLGDGFTAHVMPTHHFSGRDFKPNSTLWVSYVLETPGFKVYLGGDSGYGKHFAEIGARFNGIDLAILENGQYDKRWKYNHMQPEEVMKAAGELKAETLFPVHSGKFSISHHPWDEPLKRITELNQDQRQRIITPVIGERVNFKDKTQSFSHWWEN